MNKGISNMGGNMEGTPISQLLNDVNNVSNIPARINNNINDIKQIVNRLNQEDKIEKEQKRKKKVNFEYTKFLLEKKMTTSILTLELQLQVVLTLVKALLQVL